MILFIFLFLTNFASAQSYPPEWWKEVPREGAPDWEILPQDAGPSEVILSKRTELGIFSNFWETPFTIDGKSYRSVEGFWQMMKYPEDANEERATFPNIVWQYTRDAVSQMVMFEAKKAGDLGSENMKKMGIDWVTYQGKKLKYREMAEGEHYQIIERAMRAKLGHTAGLKELLLRTKGLVLKPDHKQENVPPAWEYFKVWMKLRDEISRSKK